MDRSSKRLAFSGFFPMLLVSSLLHTTKIKIDIASISSPEQIYLLTAW